jgi:hypothetical protein
MYNVPFIAIDDIAGTIYHGTEMLGPITKSIVRRRAK